MKINFIFLGIFLFLSTQLFSQTQTLKGVVLDKTTSAPIVGAAVLLFQDSTRLQAVVSDFDGAFRFEGLTVGRYYVDVQFMGYNPYRENDVYIRGGNQTSLILKIREASYNLDEIVVESVMSITPTQSFCSC